MFARCGAGFFPTVVGADAGRTGVGAGPEAPTPSLFLSANLVRSGRTRSPRARVHCRDRNQQASCHTDPTAPPGRPPLSRRDSRSSSLCDWAVWDAAGQGNTGTSGVRGKTGHLRVPSGETPRRTWAACKAVHFRDFLAMLSHGSVRVGGPPSPRAPGRLLLSPQPRYHGDGRGGVKGIDAEKSFNSD